MTKRRGADGARRREETRPGDRRRDRETRRVLSREQVKVTRGGKEASKTREDMRR